MIPCGAIYKEYLKKHSENTEEFGEDFEKNVSAELRLKNKSNTSVNDYDDFCLPNCYI